MLLFAKTPEAVLDDDDCPVDDQPEVERAEAHEIGRSARGKHAGQRHQHGDGDHRRGDQSGAEVAEKQEQHDDDQKSALGEVLLDSSDRAADEFCAVVKRVGNDALGKRGGDLLELVGRGLRHHARVAAGEHQHGTEHDLLAILGRGAGAQLGADADLGYIGDADRNPAARRDDDAAQVFLVRRLPRYSDQDLFAAALDIAGTPVGVVAFERLDHVGKRQTHRSKLHRIGRDMILALIAADRVDLGDAGDRAQLWTNHPVRQGP